MREIKFRVWNGKEMKKAFDLSQNPRYWWEENKDYPLMQYTGLKDNTKWEQLTEEERAKWTRDGNMPSKWNGREIYEGDLYSFKIETEMFSGEKLIRKLSNVFIKVVEYKDGAFYHGADLLADVIEHDDSFEYVGNIYENPELLGDTQ